jgi:hypothetical protein
VDSAWAIEQLTAFLHASDQIVPSHSPGDGVVFIGTVQRKDDREVAELAHVAEQILDRALPHWRTADDRPEAVRRKDRWNRLRDWAARGIAALNREEELREKLGENAPSIDASKLHPWIWEGAKSLWQSGHYGEAVMAAARKLNAETQNKLGRRDLGETKLFQEAFSTNPPDGGKRRLRLALADGSAGFKDRQAGAMQLAGGLYTGLRNIGSHEVTDELPEHEALEQLAAFSVLARMVERASVETLSEPSSDGLG